MTLQNSISPTQTFVVLDLETTGLDTENDSIIEIAAIRFSLKKNENDHWVAEGKEEKSMLINPEKCLTEEISLITHINDSMLVGKPIWWSVKERVSEFIGESVIIGHNVLFDVAMLKTHWIDLYKNIILDTFELSEFLSHESESLNLGFLGTQYGLQTDKWEHRALGDVEICLWLFLYYINQLSEQSELTKSILRLVASKEEKNNIGHILKIINEDTWGIYQLDSRLRSEHHTLKSFFQNSEHDTIQDNLRIISLSWKVNEEQELIGEIIDKYKKIHILTSWNALSLHIQDILQTHWISSILWVRHEKWCSTLYIEECIESMEIWERKLSILIWRILIWIERTETWLLKEVRTYWKEYEYIDNFRMEDWETNIFSQKYNWQLELNKVVLYEMDDYLHASHEKPECLIIKDIWFLDEKARKALSFTLNITELIEIIESLFERDNTQQRLIFALTTLQHIYENISPRPTGNLEFPPWVFGETYFYNQEDLWQKWGEWLSITTNLLESTFTEIMYKKHESILASKLWKKSQKALEYLVSYHRYTSSSTSIVIEIQKDKTILRYIPRDLKKPIETLLRNWATKSTYLLGYWISWKKVSNFLQTGLTINWDYKDHGSNKHELQIQESCDQIIIRGWVILTTSMKHIRELGLMCEKKWIKVLMQWISGGKSKISTLFQRNKDSVILIWLIDTWKDEKKIWKLAKNVIIAKLPFDPPSDPYFLSRTIWMSNNFVHYSEPMVIIRINSFIWNIRSFWYAWSIYTLDTRLKETTWWSWIYREIL